MNATQMPADLYARYEKDPLGTDAEVRQRMGVPDDRYYTVCTFPPERAGRLTVDTSRTRVTHAKKISKSDQK
jgi:hypothetical protein